MIAAAARELTVQGAGWSYRLHPDPQPIPAGTITEASTVWFHLRGPCLDIFNTELVVEGEVLDRVTLDADHLRWRWEIGFNAGLVEVELRGVDGIEGVREITTDPDVAKLTREDYASMVGDILADTVALVSLAGHRLGIARGERLLDLGRLQLMRQVFGRFEQALLEIDRAPWLRIERATKVVPLGHARRATPLELSRSLRSVRPLTKEQAAKLPPAGQKLVARLGGNLPTKVAVATKYRDNRRREHADILKVVLMWSSFLSRVAAALAQVRDPELLVRAERWKRHTQNMAMRLERLRALPLFDGVTPSAGPVAPSLLYQMVPAYKRFYRCYRDFLAGLAEVVGTFLSLPLRKTYDLYELWCFLRLARAAASRSGHQDAWRKVFAEVSANGGLVHQLEARALEFGAFRLIYQPLYREIWKSDGPTVGSFSRTMQPDIAVDLPTGADDKQIIVLDAKYRVERSLNDAVSSIHTYRDALVERIGGADSMKNRPAVIAAFLLTPHILAHDQRPWRETSAPEVFFRESYRESFRFGAISMRPGLSVEATREILEKLIALSTRV